MRIHEITDNTAETIELRVDETQYALVQRFKPPITGVAYKVITLNQQEALKLYKAIQEEIKKGG